MNAYKQIAVVGSGIMGHGIALVCARGGKSVTLIDVNDDILNVAREKMRQALRLLIENGLAAEDSLESIMNSIRFTSDMKQGVEQADLIFEAIPERVPLKEALFKQLEQFAKSTAVFASNTSGIPINTLAGMTRRPQLFVGTHFFMPAHIVPLVEVVQGDGTREDVIRDVMSLLAELGKKPVWVRKDIPGFIGNRLQHALAREAMSLVQKGVASAEDVDTVVRTSLALRLPFTGPLEQRDFNGLDTHMSIAEYLYKDLEDSKTPLALLADAVAAGNLGVKTGKGFFDWTQKDMAAVTAEKNKQMMDLLKLMDS